MFKKQILIYAITALALFAQEGVETGWGSSNFPILGIHFNARQEALGGVSSGSVFSGEGSSPASEAFIKRHTAGFSYRQHIMDMKGVSAYFGGPLMKAGVLSGSLKFLSLGSYAGMLFDEYGNPIEGEINPYTAKVSLNFSRLLLNKFAVGLRVNYLHDQISETINSQIKGYSISAIVYDIAFQTVRKLKRGALQYGVSLSNFGTVIDLDEEFGSIDLPVSFASGIRFLPTRASETAIELELEKILDKLIKVKVGLDINVIDKIFFFRAGVDAVNVGKRLATLVQAGEEQTYAITDWTILNVGFRIKTPEQVKKTVLLDTSLKIRANGLPPAGNVSFIIGI